VRILSRPDRGRENTEKQENRQRNTEGEETPKSKIKETEQLAVLDNV